MPRQPQSPTRLHAKQWPDIALGIRPHARAHPTHKDNHLYNMHKFAKPAAILTGLHPDASTHENRVAGAWPPLNPNGATLFRSSSSIGQHLCRHHARGKGRQEQSRLRQSRRARALDRHVERIMIVTST